MKTAFILVLSVLAGIGAFSFIARKFGSECVP